MNSKLLLLVMMGIVFCVNYVMADCGDQPSSDEGEVKAWLKNLGCSIKKGAEDLGDASKPIVEKIGTATKQLGTNIQNKYQELKSKLSSEEAHVEKEAAHLENREYIPNVPTEKVPLAALAGEAG